MCLATSASTVTLPLTVQHCTRQKTSILWPCLPCRYYQAPLPPVDFISSIRLYFYLLAAIDVDPFFTADPNPIRQKKQNWDLTYHQLVLVSFSCSLFRTSLRGRGEQRLQTLSWHRSISRPCSARTLYCPLLFFRPFAFGLCVVSLCVEHNKVTTDKPARRSRFINTTVTSTPDYDHVLTPKDEHKDEQHTDYFL